MSKGLVVNRGFLNGPVCPIYGFGVLAVFFLLQITGDGEFYEQNALKVFIFGVVLATAVELFGGWILDKAFHARWWDYSDRPFNLNGYICLYSAEYRMGADRNLFSNIHRRLCCFSQCNDRPQQAHG